ncbi:type II secretion system protein GspL [Brevundimonas sp. VNH65]|uniref:type II secretion system protein GspL n=1 Tax=Brevundimonas sp. VNH65 TaxID=3400917 RepID=UPI003C0F5253
MIPTRLIFIPATADQPAPLLHVDADGTVVEAGRLTLENAADYRPMRTVAIVSGSDVLVRRLALPFGGDAQVRAAALWALREELATAPERLTVTLGPIEPGREDRLVAVTASALLQAWTDFLGSLGVRADALVPDHLVLPEPDDDAAAWVRDIGGDVIVRTRNAAATVQPDLVAALTEAGFQVVDDARWRRELARIAASPPLNLSAADVRRRDRARHGALIAGMLAAGLAVSPVLIDLAVGARDRMAAARSERRIEALVQGVAPGAGEGAAERLIAEGDGMLSQGVTGAAAALFKAVETVEGAELDALSAEAGRGLSATVSYAAFQDLDRLRSAMADAGYRLEDDSTVEDGGRVVSGVRVTGR